MRKVGLPELSELNQHGVRRQCRAYFIEVCIQHAQTILVIRTDADQRLLRCFQRLQRLLERVRRPPRGSSQRNAQLAKLIRQHMYLRVLRPAGQAREICLLLPCSSLKRSITVPASRPASLPLSAVAKVSTASWKVACDDTSWRRTAPASVL